MAAVAAALAGNFLQGLPVFAPERRGTEMGPPESGSGLSRLKMQISWIQWLKLIFWSRCSQSSRGRLSQVPGNSSLRCPRSRSELLQRRHPFVDIAAHDVLDHRGRDFWRVADFFIQRWRFEKSIKQTKAEVKEDMKATEGNPAIKGKIRSIQRERARRRMMSRVKDADVIVTNPTHYAVALEYKPEIMGAPRVIAKGRDWLAQRIKALGREYDIPTVENVPLARALYRSVEVDQEIPLELYKAVAEVLAFVYKARKRFQISRLLAGGTEVAQPGEQP